VLWTLQERWVCGGEAAGALRLRRVGALCAARGRSGPPSGGVQASLRLTMNRLASAQVVNRRLAFLAKPR
jgi:hypothetical protein